MTGLDVRQIATDRRGRSLLSVEAGGRQIATIEVARARRSLAPAPRHDRNPDVADPRVPDPDAWSGATASRAAAQRWRDPHPAIRTVWQLRLHDGCDHPPPAVLEAVGAHLADDGVRRLDVRVAASDPLAAAFHGDQWIQGCVRGQVVASLAVTYPWASLPSDSGWLSSTIAPLPPRLRRAARRGAAIRPRQLPDLVQSAAIEVLATARLRSPPVGPRSRPVRGAPAGSHPFAASRYRTVRHALSFVPDPLRSAPFIDIGCGDGRVLREALRSGFPRAIGRELDPDLARRAQQVVGDAGHVVAGDALATPLPDDVGVLFLNNPFDSTVLPRFGDLVAATLERRRRPLLILYLNPRPIEPLLAAGLVLVEVNPRFSILASRAGP